MKTNITTIETRLFRKVSGMNLHGGELCFSTEKSICLIEQGEFAIVLEKKSYTGTYFNGDIDAGKNFGYDEMRVEMSFDELLENLDYIVVPNHWFDVEMDINSEDYSEENDPLTWIDNLSQYGRVIPERELPIIDYRF